MTVAVSRAQDDRAQCSRTVGTRTTADDLFCPTEHEDQEEMRRNLPWWAFFFFFSFPCSENTVKSLGNTKELSEV